MKNFISGHRVSQGSYSAFIPEPILRKWQFEDMELLQLLSKADQALGRLDMFSRYVNIDLYITMHLAKEATQSSRIEGTRTNVEESFLLAEEVPPEKRDDWEEVQNYIAAMNEAVTLLDTLPFSARLIKIAHRILMTGVRGAHKTPGEFRGSQNWIGGKTLAHAQFIPPPHHLIEELLADLEKFAHNEANPIPDLLRIALIHYQFETIHPFLDGNGRIGRLMITLYLVHKGILSKPVLYLSDYIERNRLIYYDALDRVRTHHDLAGWFRFFLTAVFETAEQGVSTFDAVLRLQNSLEARLKFLGSRTGDGLKVMRALFVRPITEVGTVARLINKSNVSAYKLIADLEKAGLIHEITGGERGRIYAFGEYLELFETA